MATTEANGQQITGRYNSSIQHRNAGSRTTNPSTAEGNFMFWADLGGAC